MTNNDRRYHIVKCSNCGDYVANNWEIRHMRNRCKGGRATLKQLVAAWLSGRLPAGIEVLEGPDRVFEAASWRAELTVTLRMAFEWVSIDGVGSTWAAYNLRTQELALCGSVKEHEDTREVTINER